jgi:small-conductance mechanosensitive channel
MFDISDFFTSWQFLLPAIFVVGGLVLGLVMEKLILEILRRIWSIKGWPAYRAVKNALRGMVTLWLVIAGLYGATRFISLSPQVLEIYQKTLYVLVLFSLTLVAARISAGLVDFYLRRAEGAMPSTTILGNIVKIVVLLTGLLVILILLDVPIAPLITAFGIGGLAVALAFQDTLSNLFSGLFVLASKQVKPGDYIKLDTGEEGYVADITWRNITVRTLPNNVVVVPNSKMASAIMTNYHWPVQEMSVMVDVGVSYGSDLQKVEEITLEVATQVLQEVQGGVDAYEPLFFYREFSYFRVEFTVVLRVYEFTDQYRLKHEFMKRLHQCYEQEGIEIPLPVPSFYPERESRDLEALSGDR